MPPTVMTPPSASMQPTRPETAYPRLLAICVRGMMVPESRSADSAFALSSSMSLRMSLITYEAILASIWFAVVLQKNAREYRTKRTMMIHMIAWALPTSMKGPCIQMESGLIVPSGSSSVSQRLSSIPAYRIVVTSPKSRGAKTVKMVPSTAATAASVNWPL